MAWYVKTVVSGGEHDVRAYKYAIYHCDECGEDSTFTVTGDFQTRPRPCKNCKSLGGADQLKSLKTIKEKVLKEIANLNAQLIHLDTEITELENKHVREQIEIITNEKNI